MGRWIGGGWCVVVAMFSFVGCTSPCETYCDVTAEKIAELSCLDVWGTSWEAQSYADEAEFVQRCAAAYEQREADAAETSPEARDDVTQACGDALDELQAAGDCSGVLLHEL